MSSVSTWSLYLRESCNLHIRKKELGGDMSFNGPVLKRALDHVTHWRRPGFLFLNRHLSHCRRTGQITFKVFYQHKHSCKPEF